jgi:hypothetical protein
MKALRLGSVESTLLYMFYLTNIKKVCNIKDDLISSNYWLIPHFYYSSGFYDKLFEKVLTNNNNEKESIDEWIIKWTTNNNVIKMYNSENFQIYFINILNILKNCDGIELLIRGFNNSLDFYYEEFINYFKCKIDIKYKLCDDISIYYCENTLRNFYLLSENKTLLIVNSMSELMKLQYDSGNLHKINENFPKLNKIVKYTIPYTFFNDGPNNNLFETVDIFNNDINNLEFDCAIVSAGAYSCLIADNIYKNLNKPVYIRGGYLLSDFGILCKRHKDQNNYQFDKLKYWINVPDKYKPENYLKIEGGCYW